MRRMALVEPSICAGHGVPCPYKRPRTGRTQQRQSRDLRSRCADRSHGSCAAADSGCRLISQARPTKFVTRVRRDPSTPPPRRTPTKPVLVCFGEDGAAERQMETCATYSAIKERYGSRLGSRTKFSRHLQIGRFGRRLLSFQSELVPSALPVLFRYSAINGTPGPIPPRCGERLVSGTGRRR